MVKQSNWGTYPSPFLFRMSAMQDGFLDKKGISPLSLPKSIHGNCISGAFSNSHGSKHPTPPLPPQTMLDARVSRIVFRVSTLYRVVGGRTVRKFRKGCTDLRGNREMTAKYEYSSTVPRTFLQDWTCPYARTLRCTTFCRRVEWRILIYWSKIICNVFWFSRKSWSAKQMWNPPPLTCCYWGQQQVSGGFLFSLVRMNSVLSVRYFLYDLLGIVKNLAQIPEPSTRTSFQ